MKKIMILGASILQTPGIKKAKEMGLKVYAVDMNPYAEGFEYADEKLIISTIDIPEILKVARACEIDAIITLASDMPMRSVAAVAEELGLVGISTDTALKATDKAVMRECLKKHGVPIPQFYKVSDYNEYKSAVKNFTKPFLLKPTDNSGSRGIFLVEDIFNEQIIDNAYEYSRKYSRCGDVIVEEFMKGDAVSVETLSVDGEVTVLQITDKLTNGAPYFVEMGHSQPTMLDKSVAEKITQVTISAVKALGIDNGPSHTEIIVTEEGPKIVEVGARLGGDCITTHLVPLSTGIDMVKCTIDIAFGDEPDAAAKLYKGSAIRYFDAKPGVIKSICGVAEAKQIPGVVQISFVKNVGDNALKINNSGERIGFVIAQAETASQAVEICEKALEAITIKVE